jgi:hypothetical protein
MDRRVRMTLPEPVVNALEAMADESDEPVARVAARLLRDRLDEVSAGTASPPPRDSFARRAGASRKSGERAPWLEPYGGDLEWRRRTWGSIVALHGRYPVELSALKQGWWDDNAHLESLSALAYWRQLLDDAAYDPVEELSFQLHIADFGRQLGREGGGVTKVWTPGAPPDDWA